jgi:hypothetical protein
MVDAPIQVPSRCLKASEFLGRNNCFCKIYHATNVVIHPRGEHRVKFSRIKFNGSLGVIYLPVRDPSRINSQVTCFCSVARVGGRCRALPAGHHFERIFADTLTG